MWYEGDILSLVFFAYGYNHPCLNLKIDMLMLQYENVWETSCILEFWMEKNLQMVTLKYVKIILNIEDLMGMNYVDVEYEVVS